MKYSKYECMNYFRKLIDQDEAVRLIYEKLKPELWDVQVRTVTLLNICPDMIFQPFSS
jgi:hypothetical protein